MDKYLLSEQYQTYKQSTLRQQSQMDTDVSFSNNNNNYTNNDMSFQYSQNNTDRFNNQLSSQREKVKQSYHPSVSAYPEPQPTPRIADSKPVFQSPYLENKQAFKEYEMQNFNEQQTNKKGNKPLSSYNNTATPKKTPQPKNSNLKNQKVNLQDNINIKNVDFTQSAYSVCIYCQAIGSYKCTQCNKLLCQDHAQYNNNYSNKPYCQNCLPKMNQVLLKVIIGLLTIILIVGIVLFIVFI